MFIQLLFLVHGGFISIYYVLNDGTVKYLNASKLGNNELSIETNDEAKYIVSLETCTSNDTDGINYVCATDINDKSYTIN